MAKRDGNDAKNDAKDGIDAIKGAIGNGAVSDTEPLGPVVRDHAAELISTQKQEIARLKRELECLDGSWHKALRRAQDAEARVEELEDGQAEALWRSEAARSQHWQSQMGEAQDKLVAAEARVRALEAKLAAQDEMKLAVAQAIQRRAEAAEARIRELEQEVGLMKESCSMRNSLRGPCF